MLAIMREKKIYARVIALVLAVMVGLTFTMAEPEEALAAAKKPAKVTKLKAAKKSTTAIKLTWKKQKSIKANGKTYKVKYKIAYKSAKAKSWKTKKTSKNVYSVKGLKSNTKYKFKVFAYYKAGGKTYKSKYCKTISATTKKKTATINVGGQKIPVTEGAAVTIPSPNGGDGYKVKDPVVTVDGDHIVIEGTTSEGLSYYYDANDQGTAMVAHISNDDDVLKAGSWHGKNAGNAYEAEPLKKGVVVYWTCDGTEPQVGQEDLKGACRYTRCTRLYAYGHVSDPKAVYQTTQLRGTTKYGERDIIFNNNDTIEDENIFWVKAYSGKKLIFENFVHYNKTGYDRRPDMKQIYYDRIDELDRLDDELWGPKVIK